MADGNPIGDLPILTGASVDPDADLLPIVDASATAEGTTKRITVKELIANTSSFVQSGSAPTYGWASRTVAVKLAEGQASATDFKNQDGTAVSTAVSDNSTGLQSAVTYCFTNGVELIGPSGNFQYGTGLTLPDTAGVFRMRGLGRPKNFTGGVNGDPTAAQGFTLTYTGSTGDAFASTLSGATKRQHITLDNLYIQGNSAGASGYGVHFVVSDASSAILYAMRDVVVNGAKQHGIFVEGNVIESNHWGVRLLQNGGAGFKAAITGTGIPGEHRFFGSKADSNDIGFDLSGGGHFSFHGSGAGGNTTNGLAANGVVLQSFDIQLEANGTASGNGALITDCYNPLFFGVLMTVISGGTGNGIKFVNCVGPQVRGFTSNSGSAGAGYDDLFFDSTTTRSDVTGYLSDDFVDRVTYEAQGGHLRHTGGYWQTGQPHGTEDITVSGIGTITPNASQNDQVQVTATAAVAYTVGNPTMFTNFHRGQRLAVHIYNNSGGVITTTWDTQYHLAGAWNEPANGKTRTILFSWNETRQMWLEIARAAADIT